MVKTLIDMTRHERLVYGWCTNLACCNVSAPGERWCKDNVHDFLDEHEASEGRDEW